MYDDGQLMRPGQRSSIIVLCTGYIAYVIYKYKTKDRWRRIPFHGDSCHVPRVKKNLRIKNNDNNNPQKKMRNLRNKITPE